MMVDMSEPIDLLAIYLHLAKSAWKRLQMPDRDRLLVISGFIAAKMKSSETEKASGM